MNEEMMEGICPLNEGVIPMNFNWRAGNQQPVQNGWEYHNDTGNPANGYVTKVPNKGELYNSLAGEIDLEIKKFTDNKSADSLSETDKIIIKTSIENKLRERFGGYKKYVDNDFYQYLNGYVNLAKYNGIVDNYFLNNCLNSFVDPNKNIYKSQNQGGFVINE